MKYTSEKNKNISGYSFDNNNLKIKNKNELLLNLKSNVSEEWFIEQHVNVIKMSNKNLLDYT